MDDDEYPFYDPVDDWEENRYRRVAPYGSRLVTCKYCGVTGFHWYVSNGAWSLQDDQNNPHKCLKRPSFLQAQQLQNKEPQVKKTETLTDRATAVQSVRDELKSLDVSPELKEAVETVLTIGSRHGYINAVGWLLIEHLRIRKMTEGLEEFDVLEKVQKELDDRFAAIYSPKEKLSDAGTAGVSTPDNTPDTACSGELRSGLPPSLPGALVKSICEAVQEAVPKLTGPEILLAWMADGLTKQRKPDSV